MVGSAVAMMVWFSAARNTASIRPKKMVRTSAWLIAARGALAAAVASAGVALDFVAAPYLPDAHPDLGAGSRRGLRKIHRAALVLLQSSRRPPLSSGFHRDSMLQYQQ